LKLKPIATPKRLMPKRESKKKTAPPAILRGWQKIADFLGQPVSVAERWAKTGMPVVHQGRSVTADPQKLNEWQGREAGEPVHVATDTADLTSELKRGLSFVRKVQREGGADD
jgi:hypothetical protein